MGRPMRPRRSYAMSCITSHHRVFTKPSLAPLYSAQEAVSFVMKYRENGLDTTLGRDSTAVAEIEQGLDASKLTRQQQGTPISVALLRVLTLGVLGKLSDEHFV